MAPSKLNLRMFIDLSLIIHYLSALPSDDCCSQPLPEETDLQDHICRCERMPYLEYPADWCKGFPEEVSLSLKIIENILFRSTTECFNHVFTVAEEAGFAIVKHRLQNGDKTTG